MAEHNEIGKIGENLASSFLMKQGFSILERNYHVPVGEIDIVAKKDNSLRFIEVKSVKVTNFNNLDRLVIRPEDNLTSAKWLKLLKAVQIYLKHKGVPHETPYQIDLACVYVNELKREGKVKLLQNIHKERE
jgi:putative endonuclease